MFTDMGEQESDVMQRLTDFRSVHWWFDVLDILLVMVLIFQIFKFVRGTAAIRIFIGALGFYGMYKLVKMLQMELLTEILGQFIGVGFIALIVVFQQEIRKFLLLIASPKIYNRFWITKWFFRWKNPTQSNILWKEAVLKACEHLARDKTGALIVIADENTLSTYKTLGEEVDSRVSANLLESIFHKESPMHDGAVFICDNRIAAARCVLPVTDRQDLPASFGLRHRAAIGVTEHSEAVAIVVSEETGKLSYCKSGKLRNNISLKRLSEMIEPDPTS